MNGASTMTAARAIDECPPPGRFAAHRAAENGACRPDERPVQLELVIPALNEELRLGPSLAAVCKHLATLSFSARVLVVDNGSVDATAETAAAADSAAVPVRVIGCRDRGKGAAVRAGMQAARARWVGFCDADLATPIDTLDEVAARLAEGAPVVIGSRRCTGASYTHKQPAVRRAGGWAFRRLSRDLVPGVADTQCGFKFFTADAAAVLFRDIGSDGFSFDLELLARAAQCGLPVIEVPVAWTDRDGSSLRPVEHGREVLREVRRLRRLAATEESADHRAGAAAG
jgi:dolichyl-phosphate beta-glucosyltransferase